MSEKSFKKRPWYKVLERGKSFCGGTMKWSLPTAGATGAWHSVEGPLERCKNGFHLTDNPLIFLKQAGKPVRSRKCYLVEYDPEEASEHHGELLVRRCRLVKEIPLSELEPSAALTLLQHVWKHCDYTSHDRMNGAMRGALRLAIESGMPFHDDDLHWVAEDMRPQFWADWEIAYALACGESRAAHGGNPSAVAAIEKHLGRKPFIIHREPPGSSRDGKLGPRVRLCVGSLFFWHIEMKERIQVKVTSINDQERYLIACSYKRSEPDSYERQIDRRFRITHDDIAEYHAALRKHLKEQKEKQAS